VIRIVFASGFLVLAIVAVGAAFFVGASTPSGNVLINLGTEIFGILVTLAVVDLFLERRRLQERGRELGWAMLHQIERAVWVWQGGPRRLGSDELLGLIAGIDPAAPPEPFTRTLLVNLGHRAREVLEIEARAAKILPELEKAAVELSSLRALDERDTAPTMRMVTEVLEAATVDLARMLGQPAQKLPAGLVRHRDSKPAAQAARYYGEREARGERDAVRDPVRATPT
jgi:hypothetical protein